jgi:hypothetical protein
MNKPFFEQFTEHMGDIVTASTVRPATRTDVLCAALSRAYGKCQHTVVFDVSGFIYDIRKCYTCGAHLGYI